MKIELNEKFEFPDDKNWGKKFWRGFFIAVMLAMVLAVVIIRVGAYLIESAFERWLIP